MLGTLLPACGCLCHSLLHAGWRPQLRQRLQHKLLAGSRVHIWLAIGRWLVWRGRQRRQVRRPAGQANTLRWWVGGWWALGSCGRAPVLRR